MNCDDLYIGVDMFCHYTSSTGTTTSTQWNDYDINIRKILNNFHGISGHTLYQQRFIHCMYKFITFLTRDLLRIFSRLIKVGSKMYHLGS